MLNCGLYLAILCIFILFAVINPDFLTVRNMVNVFEQSAYYLVCAVGITFVLVSGANDMSVGSQVAFSSVVATLYLAAGEYPGFHGDHAGSCPGHRIVQWTVRCGHRSSAFYWNHCHRLCGARSGGLLYKAGDCDRTSQRLYSICMDKDPGLSNLTWIAVLIVLLGIYVLKYTAYGRRVYACGSNPVAAGVMGINVKWIKISVYVIAAMSAAVASMMLMSRMGAARSGTADLLHMECVAAAVIGGTSLKGGQGGLIGTFIGVFLVSMIRNGLNSNGINSFWQLVFTGESPCLQRCWTAINQEPAHDMIS